MPPLTNKTVGLFFVKVTVIYAVLMVPWPGLREGYAFLFRTAGSFAFRTFGSAGRVSFEAIDPFPTAKDAKDTAARLENLKTRKSGTMEMNSRLMGYLPTAFGVALVLATPVPWKRRAWALLWCLLLMSAFAGLELALRLLDAFSDRNPLMVFALPGWAKAAVLILLNVVGMSPVTAYIAPIFIWILVTFRREDWKTLRPANGDRAPTAVR